MSAHNATIINISRLSVHLAAPGQLLDAADFITDTLAGTTPTTTPAAPEGTHVDAATGLMWSKATNASGKTWAEAQEAAAAVRLGGFTDWRLPTIRELLTLVDYTRHEPAIDTAIFECEPRWYWSATPLASSPSGCAWGVGFSDGGAGFNGQHLQGRVRAVRSVSPAASGQ